MKKIIRYAVTAVLSIAAIILVSKYVRGVFAGSMNSYVDNINADIEAKRQALLEKGVFHEGVSVNGVQIGGMSYQEAKDALKAVEEDLVKDVGFSVRYGNRGVLSIGKSFFKFGYNTEEILGEAIMLASEGEFEALRQEIDDIAENGRNYTIEYTVTPKESDIADVVRAAGDSLYVEPENATVEVNPDSVYDPEGERFSYIPGKTGYIAKSDEAVDEILARIKTEAYGTVYMEGEIIEPEIGVEDLEGRIVRRSHFTTSYAMGTYGIPNRVFNIIKACGLVNGTVLPPQDPDDPDNKDYIFSAEETLGPRLSELGWLDAPGFINGGSQSVNSPGGGVCQVSSTLYNAVILSDLKIVFRINHSAHVGYVAWGQDATIDTGRIDFKFANNTSSDIYIFMWVDEPKKTVHAEIWGEPFPEEFDEIKFWAELVEEIPPTETQYVVNPSLSAPYWYVKNSAKTGYRYQSFKQYYKNGSPVTEPIKVALSEYKMHPKRIAVWRGFTPGVDYLDPQYKINPHPEEP